MLDKNIFGNFTLEELRENGFMEALSDPSPRNDLTNPVHEIFLDWPSLTPEDLEVLMPTLRLATAFMWSPASMSFLHAIMYGRRNEVNDLFWELEQVHPYTDSLRHEVILGLQDMQSHVTWGFLDYNDPEFKQYYLESGANASTLCHPDDKFSFRGSLPAAINAVGVKVRVNQENSVGHVKRLLALPHQTPEILNSVLRYRFWNAKTIVHELAHAIKNMTVTNGIEYAVEPYYRTQAINELGWAWENEVFGGIPHPTQDTDLVNFPMQFTKFPTENHTTRYQSAVVVRGGLKGSGTYYYVSMDFIANLQKQSKWDEVANEGFDTDPNVLKVPKQIGVRRPNRSFLNVDPLWNKSESSEGEYEADSENRVVRIEKVERAFRT